MLALRLAVFDLDHTLFDPATVPAEVVEPVWVRVRAANLGAASVPPEVLDAALEATRHRPFSQVAEEFGLPRPLRRAWTDAFGAVEITQPLAPDPMAVDLLERVTVPTVLLTTGFPKLQRSKLARLGFTDRFDEVVVDALTSEGTSRGKAHYLAQIRDARQLAGAEVVVVGDREDSEIAAGLALGMVTIHLRPGDATAAGPATHTVRRLADVLPILQRYGIAR